MTKLDSLILSSFEDYAEGYYPACEWNELLCCFTDYEIDREWRAYKEGARLALESLGMGIEAHKHGAMALLACKVKDNTLVLKSGFVAVGESGFGRAEL